MNKRIIGMIHLGRIRWVSESDIKNIIEDALYDLEQLQKWWMENICIINESDIPYKINISDIEKKYFLKIAKKIKKKAKVNLGICVLYNDWKATLDIAKAINAQFVRIDTFVDLVESDAGIIYPEAEKIKEHQNKIWAENVLLLTDIHPKYKKLLEDKTLKTSANEAFSKWSNWVIITGTCSWDAVQPKEVKELKREIWNKPLYLWSWVSEENIEKYWEYIDWVFIWTSLKYEWKINLEKTKSFISLCKKLENSK